MMVVRFAVVVMASLLLVAPSASATTVLQVGFDDLTKTSQWIVRAHVLSVRTVDLRDRNQGIYTDVDLSVTEVYRGANVPRYYTLRLLGGRGADGMTLHVPGMPHFVSGDDVVLFLEKTSLGHIPTGMGQGVWRISPTPGGDEWAHQAIGEAHMIERGPDGHLRAADPSKGLGPMLVTDLVWEIVQRVYAADDSK
jgi:hypothetical protein